MYARKKKHGARDSVLFYFRLVAWLVICRAIYRYSGKLYLLWQIL